MLPVAGATSVRFDTRQAAAVAQGLVVPDTGPVDGAYLCTGEHCVGPVTRTEDLLEATRVSLQGARRIREQ